MCPREDHLYCRFKRIADATLAGLLLILLSPVLLVLAGLVATSLGRPVLFRQDRPGLGGHIFTLIKFKTMRSPGDAGSVDDSVRLTRFGRLLRSTSLDELPELVNVLRGHMSFVGPRPLLVEYLPRYTPEQARRHLIRPGLTGLAQVRGRNTLGWSERFALDVEYVDRHGLRLDASILVSSAVVVLRRTGVTAPGHVTVPRFTGSSEASPGDGAASRPVTLSNP
jgi:lipopolysaccharide/colanic/teichoic acid biosynthesis glycosyltransferase